MSGSITKFHEDKRRREEIQNTLMDRYGMALVYLKVRYPGLCKNNSLTNNILKELEKLISDIYSNEIHYKLYRTTMEGPNIIMLMKENADIIKSTAITIEDNHLLGKCIGIEVYNQKNKKRVTRELVGVEERGCIVCECSKSHCLHNSIHSTDDVIRSINKAYLDYMETFYWGRL